MQKTRLWYTEPAPMENEDLAEFESTQDRPDDGWEKWSLPIGNGNLGVCVFGRTQTERLQFSEKSLTNSYQEGGQNNFAEVYLDFHQEEVTDYSRFLDLEEAVAGVHYRCEDVTYSRECFASYPDNVFAMKIAASEPGKITFTFRPTIPYLDASPELHRKTGTVNVSGSEVHLVGELVEFGVRYAGVFRVIPSGGTLEACENGVLVRGADHVVILAACGTNYRLESRVFTQANPRKKLSPYPDPLRQVLSRVDQAERKGYEMVRAAHIADHRALFGRVELTLNDEATSEQPTDVRLRAYQEGGKDSALEALFFQYGRYLLIASSRPGTLPAHLQGAWNRYDRAPWSAGYWHNINVQMNYWPAFSTNLCETFEAYAEYYLAYRPLAERHADHYIRDCHPDRYQKGKNGWIIGTGAWAYEIQGLEVKNHELAGHSGPGTGGLTSLLFWEYYRFTGDRTFLEEIGYPALSSMSCFLSKCLEEREGHLLARYSASPEQRRNGVYYHTIGCAFDQQMIFENHRATLLAAHELGIEDESTATFRQQMDRLDPVQIGSSGQIKEYREEKAYGEIGEYTHRHVSHLVGLYPGTLISLDTPEWLEAAKTTLNKRGDKSTGWGMAHRLLLWARAKEGEHAYRLFRLILQQTTYMNLWTSHPPFQIDANFGATAGVAEMLMQSHAASIEILPALPATWTAGKFRGLLARGGFEVDVEWRDNRIVMVLIHSRKGGVCRLHLRGFHVPQSDPPLPFKFDSCTGLLEFSSSPGTVVSFRDR